MGTYISHIKYGIIMNNKMEIKLQMPFIDSFT